MGRRIRPLREKKQKEVYEKLKQGEDFFKMASVVSIHPAVSVQQG